MKRSVQERFRPIIEKSPLRQKYILNDKNSPRNRVLRHYFPHYDLHPLNPDYISPRSSKGDVRKAEKPPPFASINTRNHLPRYRISKENFSVKEQYEESRYTGIQMPKHSKSYKLKRTERYINDPESFPRDPIHSTSSSKKSTRSKEKRHRNYPSGINTKGTPEEEEFENTGRNRERYERELILEQNDLNLNPPRKVHIPFSGGREPEGLTYDEAVETEKKNRIAPARETFEPQVPPSYPPAGTYPIGANYPVIPPSYPPFPGVPPASYPAPAAPPPSQAYSFNPAYPSGSFPYPNVPFAGAQSNPPHMGHLNQSPMNLNYYNYSSPGDIRRMNAPPPNNSYNPFVYNVEVDNQQKAKNTRPDSNRPQDNVGVSTNQKALYSGNELQNPYRSAHTDHPNPTNQFQSQQNHSNSSNPPNQNPFPYDIQHFRYSSDKAPNPGKSEWKPKPFTGAESNPATTDPNNYDWSQQNHKGYKQEYVPDFNQAIENAYKYSGGSIPRAPMSSDVRETDHSNKPKYGGQNYGPTYDLNSNMEAKKADKVPYADQYGYGNQKTGGFNHQNKANSVENNYTGANLPHHHYSNNSNRYHHTPLKSTRYLNVDGNFKDPGTSRR